MLMDVMFIEFVELLLSSCMDFYVHNSKAC